MDKEIQQNKEKILKIWKKWSEWNTKKINHIEKKYKVKFVEREEYYAIMEFKESGVRFTCPYDINFDDHDLTGDALKFAQKHFDINDSTYFGVEEDLEKEGFEKYDSDEGFDEWRKDGVGYSVSHYANKEEDIEVLITGDKRNG